VKEFVITFIPCTETEVRADCGGHDPITYSSREGKFNEVYVNTAKFDKLPIVDQFFIIAHEAQNAFANTPEK